MIQSVRNDIDTILNQVERQGKRSNLSLYLHKLCRQIDDPSIKEDDTKRETQKKKTLGNLLNGYTPDTMALYRHAYCQWQRMHEGGEDTLCFEMETTAPLIVGKGDANVHEFGISLQTPWGTPIIPGSAVKGVLSSFAAGHGGEVWQRSRKEAQDGEFGLAMFGGIDTDRQELAGGVQFMDAWWVPRQGQPFMEDIINVHCRSYYQQRDWPHGMDNPLPNPFLVIRPGEHFFFVVRGPAGWCNLAREMLLAAAGEQGFGAKTRVGYGRLSYVETEYVKTEVDFRAEIPTLEDKQLAQLYTEADTPSLRESIAMECHRRAYSTDLRKLFMKFRPAAVLLADLREEKSLQWHEAGTIRKQFSSQLPPNGIDTTDPDVQAIFALCHPLAPNGVVAETWLARFAPTADDLLAMKTAGEIEEFLLDYAEARPPLEEFRLAIERHSRLSEEEKTSCLVAFSLQQGERNRD